MKKDSNNNTCSIGGCEKKSRLICPTCIHWVPNKKHRYYKCSRFQVSRILCDLPVSRCKSCEYYIKPVIGRPCNDYEKEIISKNARRKYMTKYMEKRRKKDKKKKEFDEATVDKEHQAFINRQLKALPTANIPKVTPLTIDGKPIKE